MNLDNMQPIEVTVRFNIGGKVTPQRFTWKGSEYTVESTGRQWEDADERHVLVMVPGGRIFELVYIPLQGLWFLRSAETGRKAV